MHLAPDHESALAQLLASNSDVRGADPGQYERSFQTSLPHSAQRNATIKDGVLQVAPPAEPRGRRSPLTSLCLSG